MNKPIRKNFHASVCTTALFRAAFLWTPSQAGLLGSPSVAREVHQLSKLPVAQARAVARRTAVGPRDIGGRGEARLPPARQSAW
jgi:hypothetical protein